MGIFSDALRGWDSFVLERNNETDGAQDSQFPPANQVQIQRYQQMNASLKIMEVDCEECLAAGVAGLRIENQRLEDFVHIASHDLRSPLRAMMSLVEWIRDDLESAFGTLPEAIQADLLEVAAQGRRMDKLLKDLLEFSQIPDACDTDKEFDPAAVIKECIDITTIPEAFAVRVAPELPSVQCSPVEFALVMRNLISNSVKYHDRTGGRVEIDGWTEGRFGYFRVRDDGPGIEPEYAEQVFEMFKTLDSNRGSGIGLGLVKKITTQHGGMAAVLPNPNGRGCDFIFSLPLDIRSAEPRRSAM